MTADDIIAQLGLKPHPEGGHYKETWRAPDVDGRPSATCIYFLLGAGDASHWHKVDAAELWLWHAGDPLILSRAATEDGPAEDAVLGPNLANGGHPQLIVPQHHWQAARSTGAWSLVSCVVSPGFSFDGFALAPPDFDIPRA
ncbi:MAG: cupin domain-containing protein [Pseudomonadota bacterium]